MMSAMNGEDLRAVQQLIQKQAESAARAITTAPSKTELASLAGDPNSLPKLRTQESVSVKL